MLEFNKNESKIKISHLVSDEVLDKVLDAIKKDEENKKKSVAMCRRPSQ
jgi:hypothetical protein